MASLMALTKWSTLRAASRSALGPPETALLAGNCDDDGAIGGLLALSSDMGGGRGWTGAALASSWAMALASMVLVLLTGAAAGPWYQ